MVIFSLLSVGSRRPITNGSNQFLVIIVPCTGISCASLTRKTLYWLLPNVIQFGIKPLRLSIDVKIKWNKVRKEAVNRGWSKSSNVSLRFSKFIFQSNTKSLQNSQASYPDFDCYQVEYTTKTQNCTSFEEGK